MAKKYKPLKALREFRIAKGYTQNKLSMKCGIMQSTISYLENGTVDPTHVKLFTYMTLAEALDISVISLIKDIV